MRFLASLLLAAWCLPSAAHAQGNNQPEIKKIHVGFQSHQKEDQTTYKVGLWTPVYIDLFGGADGIDAQAGDEPPYLQIETVDSEDVGTRIRVPVKLPPLASKTFMGYVKTGRMGRSSSEVRVTLHVNGREYAKRGVEHFDTLDIDAHLYLALGSKMTDLDTAVANIDKQPGDEGS